MSQRAPVRTAFENLKPTIIRQPTRTSISAEAESKVLETAAAVPAVATPPPPATLPSVTADVAAPAPAAVFSGATLLTKKRKEVLIPVTFRIPQSLKLQLEKVAQARELNQTDLINEGIALNLQRYQ